MIFFEERLAAGLGKFPAGTVFLAAVSGGADSSAMLAGLAELRKKADFTLHCVHVEHGIRPAEESRGDALAVEALCKKLEVPCRIVSVPRGKIAACAGSGGPGIEGAARFFRHKALNREARRAGAGRILTAHTRDDALETLLMRVLRGSGPAGLAPMPRSRGRLLRPLLDLTRQDALAYLNERNIPYRTDSTNADIRYLRNRVRLRLIPLLDDFFPSWRSSLAALAETQALTAEFLASEAGTRLPWEKTGAAGKAESGASGRFSSVRLNEKDFFGAPLILREEALFAGADMLASASAKKSLVPAVPRRSALRRAAKQKTAFAGDLGPVRLERRNGFIEMKPAPESRFERGFSLLIKEAGFYTLTGRVLGKNRELRVRAGVPPGSGRTPGSVLFSAGLPLALRSRREGDRILRAGHKRRLSDILDRNARSEYTGIITACDAEGTAAFIGLGRDSIALCGERAPSETGGRALYLFEVSWK